MADEAPQIDKPRRIRWYRCRLTRQDLSLLNKRSNLKGFAQTLSFLGLLAATGGLAVWSAAHWPWYVTVLVTFLHGTCCYFLINGFHELVHESVFRTRWLNGFFLRILAFLGWHNHHWFWASHTEHHKYTLHDPDDLEVVLPMKVTLWDFLRRGFVDPHRFIHGVVGQFRRALGNYNPNREVWTSQLFPAENVQGRRKLIRWARILLIGHGLIVGTALALGWWMVPVVVTLTPAYGRWLQFLCNESQHMGLQDKVPDFRLCCRTIYLNPLLRFFYWNMNYHTEHHMYAAVPFHSLPALHRAVAHDFPVPQKSFTAALRLLGEIGRRQASDPAYVHSPEFPPTAAPPKRR